MRGIGVAHPGRLLVLALALAGCRSEAGADAPAAAPAAPAASETPRASETPGVVATEGEPLELQPRGIRPATVAPAGAGEPEPDLALGGCAWLDAEGPRTRLFPVVFGAGAPRELADVCFQAVPSPVIGGVRYLTFAGPVEVERRPRTEPAWQLRLVVPWPLPEVESRSSVVAPAALDERRGQPGAGEAYLYADAAPLGADQRIGGDVDWRAVSGELAVMERGEDGLSGVLKVEATLVRTVPGEAGLTLGEQRFELSATVHVVE